MNQRITEADPQGIQMDDAKIRDGKEYNSAFYIERLSKYDEDWIEHFNEALFGSREQWKQWKPKVFSPESIEQLTPLLSAGKDFWMVIRARSLLLDQEFLRLYRIAVVVAEMAEELPYLHAIADSGGSFLKTDAPDYHERCVLLLNELNLEEKRAVLKSTVKRCGYFGRLVEYLLGSENDPLERKAETARTIAQAARERATQALHYLLYFREFGGWLDGISSAIPARITGESPQGTSSNPSNLLQTMPEGPLKAMFQMMFGFGDKLDEIRQHLKGVPKMVEEAQDARENPEEHAAEMLRFVQDELPPDVQKLWRALQENGWSVNGAAKAIRMPETTARRRVQDTLIPFYKKHHWPVPKPRGWGKRRKVNMGEAQLSADIARGHEDPTWGVLGSKTYTEKHGQ